MFLACDNATNTCAEPTAQPNPFSDNALDMYTSLLLRNFEFLVDMDTNSGKIDYTVEYYADGFLTVVQA